MIICPNCHHQEYAGALFCSECATQLVVTGKSYVVGETDIFGNDQLELYTVKKRPVSSRIAPGEKIFLRVMSDSSLIELAGRREFTIGRGVKGQLILPDVDLGLYEAHAMGVSRLHAVIKVTDEMVMIMDLGSSNGTLVNDRKIEGHQECALKHGDVVALGRLQFEVLYDV